MKSVPTSASLPLFHGELWLARLRRSLPCSFRRFAPGQVLLQPGEAAEAVYVVDTGVLSVECTSVEGKPAILALLGPGDAFGQETVFREDLFSQLWDRRPGSPDAVRVQALSGGSTLLLPIADLAETIRRDPLLSMWFAASLNWKVRALQRALGRALSLPVRDRVLDVLRELAESYGCDTGGRVSLEIPLSQDHIAALVGATRESVNRALRQLMDAGLVRRRDLMYDVSLAAWAPDQDVEPGVS
jgi:CRP/FNR family cyclic AMP-dependent transcriptional regulator